MTGANTVQIDTGGALVDGIRYQNSAPVSVNIPSAVGGGNTRIDRIVLRATWATPNCVITVISGTDEATPSVPAITQTPGTTYDIKLYQALVDTSGAVTLTEERTFAGGIVARQGGHANTWFVAGTTNYFPAKTKIQCGVYEIPGGAGTYTITFPTPFVYEPIVGLLAGEDGFAAAKVGTTSAYYFEIITSTDITGTNIPWIAIGAT